MIIFTRFRNLPDEQMKHIVDYVESGRPIVGMRTATHAFDLKTSRTYQQYSWNSKAWDGGFGRQVLGETWINHHGHHGKQSTRGVIAKGQESHPILRGIQDGRNLGARPTFTKSACRCPATASRWSWVRCSKACGRPIPRPPESRMTR